MKFSKKPSVRLVAVIAIISIFVIFAPVASAHPLGNFTVNHYSRLEIATNQVRVRFVLDLAEIPTFQERQLIDPSGDGNPSADEQTRYLNRKIEEIRTNLHLTLDGMPRELSLVPNSAELAFPPGQGGLLTERLSAWFSTPLSPSSGRSFGVNYRDETYTNRIGWREIVVRTDDGISILKTDAPSNDISDELRNYPPDLLSQPLNQRETNFTFQIGSVGSNARPNIPVVPNGIGGAVDLSKDAFTDLINAKELSLTVMLVSLVAALFLGALHAFTPGHGKAIVGAYLVGTRGTAKHAILLGLAVTVTHTAGVYGLGLVTLFAAQYISPEQLFPWLGVTSGLLVAVIGTRLFFSRLGDFGRVNSVQLTMGHERPHDDDVMHDHVQSHDADSEHTHGESDELAHARLHIPAMIEGAPLTWQNLVSLGISGGLLPCSSALVVMLSAIALGRIAFGLVLIVAFSVGLAGVLILTGLALLYAGKLAGRWVRGGRMQGLFFRVVPIGSALVVMLLGIGIAAEALMQTGLIP